MTRPDSADHPLGYIGDLSRLTLGLAIGNFTRRLRNDLGEHPNCDALLNFALDVEHLSVALNPLCRQLAAKGFETGRTIEFQEDESNFTALPRIHKIRSRTDAKEVE